MQTLSFGKFIDQQKALRATLVNEPVEVVSGRLGALVAISAESQIGRDWLETVPTALTLPLLGCKLRLDEIYAAARRSGAVLTCRRVPSVVLLTRDDYDGMLDTAGTERAAHAPPVAEGPEADPAPTFVPQVLPDPPQTVWLPEDMQVAPAGDTDRLVFPIDLTTVHPCADAQEEPSGPQDAPLREHQIMPAVLDALQDDLDALEDLLRA